MKPLLAALTSIVLIFAPAADAAPRVPELVNPPAFGPHPVGIAGMSENAEVMVFSTSGQLAEADDDSSFDLYALEGGEVTSRHARRCTKRFRRVGRAIAANAVAGPNVVRFRPRRSFKPGAYRLRLTAIDARGSRPAERRASFALMRR